MRQHPHSSTLEPHDLVSCAQTESKFGAESVFWLKFGGDMSETLDPPMHFGEVEVMMLGLPTLRKVAKAINEFIAAQDAATEGDNG